MIINTSNHATDVKICQVPFTLFIFKIFIDTFGTSFSDEEVDTIGGLVMQAFGHLPARGETVDIDGYQFKVAMADSRRIIQVHVKLPDDAPQPKLED